MKDSKFKQYPSKIVKKATIDLLVSKSDPKNYEDNWYWEIGCGDNSLKMKDGYKTKADAWAAGNEAWNKFTAHKD